VGLIDLSRYGSEVEAAVDREPWRVTARAIVALIRRGLRLESCPGRGIPGSEGNRHDVAPARFDHRTPNTAHVYPHVLLPESNLPPPQSLPFAALPLRLFVSARVGYPSFK
jgi:hypothetical protein